MADEALWTRVIPLQAHASSAAMARSFVRDQLVATDMGRLVEDVVLVASELATNAVRHARAPFRVTLQAFDDTLRLTAAAGSPSGPQRRKPPTLESGGRGIAIVEHLSRDWGVIEQGGGKSV